MESNTSFRVEDFSVETRKRRDIPGVFLDIVLNLREIPSDMEKFKEFNSKNYPNLTELHIVIQDVENHTLNSISTWFSKKPLSRRVVIRN